MQVHWMIGQKTCDQLWSYGRGRVVSGDDVDLASTGGCTAAGKLAQGRPQKLSGYVWRAAPV